MSKPRIRIIEDNYRGPLWSPQVKAGVYMSTIYCGMVLQGDGKYHITHQVGARTPIDLENADYKHNINKEHAFQRVFCGMVRELERTAEEG